MSDADDRLQDALGVAYRYLSRRERTVDELRRHLERNGIDVTIAEAAVLECHGLGCLDDARFARLFAQDKRELEQWGEDRIRRALLDRGIEPDLVQTTLAGEPASELDRALALLGRRFPSTLGERRERDRALGVLLRKGYEPELALEAVTIHARG
jgi:regulatory protein